jgi:hypothetical protein
MVKWSRLFSITAMLTILPAAFVNCAGGDFKSTTGLQQSQASNLPGSGSDPGTDDTDSGSTPESPSTALPDASNTGWKHTGVTLTSAGAMTITTAGTVIDGKDINGDVTIKASNVTIRRSRVHTTGSYFPIRIQSGTNILIEDVEIDGGGFSSKAVLVEGGSVTLRRLDIHDSEDGLHLGGNGPTVLENSWIHDPRHAADGHSDGMEIEGVSNLIVRNNNIDYAKGNSGAVMLDNWGGAVTNVTITGNRIAGGSYMMYMDGRFNSQQVNNIRVGNNRFVQGSSTYGVLAAMGSTLQNICWQNNAYENGGQISYSGPSGSQVSCTFE